MIKPNKSQNAAICHQPSPLMILAGAGTGKTFTLQNKIVHLINYYEVKPKHILAITYTEKAAKEAGYELKIGKFPFSASGKASAAGHNDGFIKLVFDAKLFIHQSIESSKYTLCFSSQSIKYFFSLE